MTVPEAAARTVLDRLILTSLNPLDDCDAVGVNSDMVEFDEDVENSFVLLSCCCCCWAFSSNCFRMCGTLHVTSTRFSVELLDCCGCFVDSDTCDCLILPLNYQ